MGCLFCNIIEKKVPADVVHDDADVLAFRDIRPVAPTHVLVIPKKHIAAIHEAEEGDALVLGKLLVAARKIADELGLVDDGFRLVINDGEHAGQTVHHVHLHLLGGRPMTWPPG